MRAGTRWGIRGFVVVMVILGAGWLVLYVGQWVGRWRAERLYADWNALQVRESTWADFQRFQSRWGAWGYYNGRCEPSRCLYRVQVTGYVASLPYGDDFSSSWFLLHKVLDAIGLRGTGAGVGVEVAAGKIVGKSYTLSSFSNLGGELDDVVSEGPRLHPYENSYPHLEHSMRLLKSYLFGVEMTPFEEEAERLRLSRFRFGCMTSLWPCGSHRQMLPDAWAEFEREKPAREIPARVSCNMPLWVVARDADAVVLGYVLSAKLEDGFWGVRLSVRERLKGASEAGAKEIMFEVPQESLPSGDAQTFPYRSMVAMGRFRGPIGDESSWLLDGSACGFGEATAATLAEVARGIAADFAPARPDLY